MNILKKFLVFALSISIVFFNINPIFAQESQEDPEIVEETIENTDEIVDEVEENLVAEKTETVNDDQINVDDTFVNPHYVDVLDESDLNKPIKRFALFNLLSLDESQMHYSIEDAGLYFRQQLLDHNESFELHLTYTKTDASVNATEYSKIMGRQVVAFALAHTGSPIGGDYIDWQFGGYHVGISGKGVGGGKYEMTYKYTVTYYTTLAQEQEVNTAVQNLLDSLNVYDKTSFEKVKAIYDWMCANISYDYYNLNNEDYVLKYTAYGALINRTCVCQGYANLFYRLALELGVDARIITGFGNGGAHAWNIVQIGDYYYNLDSTWDAGYDKHSYFLINEGTFSRSHVRDADYVTEAFLEQYVICPVTMNPVDSISIQESDMKLVRNSVGSLSFEISPNYTLMRDYVKWSSSNPDVVSITQNGDFTCLQPGTAIISATTLDQKTDSIKIKVLHADIENGWYSEDGSFYYYENHDEVIGWHTIDNLNYFFNEDATLKTGWYNVNQVYSFVDPTTGRFICSTRALLNNNWYYFNDGGIMETSSCVIDGDTYYFNQNGSMKLGWVKVNDDYKFVREKDATYIKSDWLKVDNKWYYLDDDGNRVTGLRWINNVLYFFNSDGSLYTGWLTLNKDTYYFKSTGAVNEWNTIDGSLYYFKDYKMATGYLVIEDTPYFFGSDGKAYTGWQEIDDEEYYFQDAKASDGWNKIDSKWYYFDEYIRVTGLKEIDNVKYYFSEDGTLYSGWKDIKGSRYYFTSKGAVDGFQTINDKTYYFKDCIMQTGFVKIDGIPYFFNEDGTIYSGWKGSYYYTTSGALNGWQTINSKKYYFKDYQKVTGYLLISSQPCMFDDSGVAYTGWKTIDGNRYYFKNGVAVNGLIAIGGNTYYFKNYKMVTGYTEINLVPYYFNEDGSMFTSGWLKLENNWYYFGNNGALNRWQKLGTKWYYFNSYKMVTGYFVISDIPYYFNENGSLFTGWLKLEDKWYYFKSTGALNGWQKVNDIWYYFDDFKMATGYIEVDGIPFYLNDNGKIFTGWKQVKNNWYYFKSTGALNGWQKISDVWYYFNDFKMASNERLFINGEYYYFNSNGSMKTGWLLLDDGNYRYYQTTGKEVSGWIKLNNKWYYLDPSKDNVMLKNITATIDGKNYKFNSKGQMI